MWISRKFVYKKHKQSYPEAAFPEGIYRNYASDQCTLLCFYVQINFVFFLISVEIILRAEAVEQAQAGDKCDFTGTLIVVPDVSQLSTPGTSTLTMVELSVKATHHKPS